MADTNGNGHTGELQNGRVTMAVIGQKLDDLIKVVQDMNAKQDKLHEAQEQRLRNLEVCGETRETRLNLLKEDVEEQGKYIEELKSNNRTWSGINSVLALVAGLVGWFKQ